MKYKAVFVYGDFLRHMRLNPMRIISASVNAEIIYLFLMYDSCEPRTTCPPSLVASVSDCGMAGLGSIPGWAHKLQCFSFSLFQLFFIQNYFIQVIWNYKNDKYIHSFMFYIELCTKYVGVGVNLVLLKDN